MGKWAKCLSDFFQVQSWVKPIPRTVGPFNVFILLNGWICLHGVLDKAGSKSVQCTFIHSFISLSSTASVASLRSVSPGAATGGVTPIFFLKKVTTFSSRRRLQRDDLFNLLFFVNSASNFVLFRLGVTPWRVPPWAIPPSDATERLHDLLMISLCT